MDVYILNSSFEPVTVIDSFQSLIWTKRYYTCGDFELYLPADAALLPYLIPDNFVKREDDDSVMVIEKLEIQTDIENGDYFIVSGRSLESLLARRIVDSQTIINEDDVVQGLKALIEGQIGDGDPDYYRALAGMTVDDTLEVPYEFITQITGTNLLEAISAICQRFGIGMRAVIQDGAPVLSFYEGSAVDVIFSPEFDNLRNSKYTVDTADLANYAKVLGEGQGTSRIGVNVPLFSPPPTKMARRELYVDARDISRNNGEVTTETYIPMLIERAREKMAEHTVLKSFEAEIAPDVCFHYKTDYDLGDIVTVSNLYGLTATPRIVEMVESWDETGYTAIPTFDALEV